MVTIGLFLCGIDWRTLNNWVGKQQVACIYDSIFYKNEKF